MIEKIKDEFGTKYSLRNDEKLSTAKDILKAIYSYSPQELYNDMSEIEHDYWDNPFGFYYNIRDLGLLVSLQKNFMREYSILIETREF